MSYFHWLFYNYLAFAEFFEAGLAQSLAFHTGPGWSVFLASAVLALVIAMLTVSAWTIKAAWRNPADALRYE